jgi:WD40 repeat protein/DNA-binding SARP family transcriptional activator
MVEFHALDGVTVTDGGREVNVGGPRQRRLLAVLLIHRNEVVSVDRLTDAVFAGEPSPGATTTMRSYIARVRKVVEVDGSPAAVVTRPPGYLLAVPDEAFDVARFEAGLAEGRSLLSRGEAAEAATRLREVLALWRGEAYAEFADEEWVQPEAQRLGELRLVAHEVLFDAELACGRAAEVTPELEALSGRHPLREGFVGQLMLALYRSGRQADALRAFNRHREVLVDELGLDPTAALRALEDRILAQDPELLAPEDAGQALRGYRIGDRLGTGADGTVFAAHLPGVDRDLVIRVIRPERADSADFVRSFEADAQRIAALRHPAIVPIHDYWREPGAAYLVMRRMHGGTLADRLERAERSGLPLADVTAVVWRIGEALAAADDVGIGHGRISARSVLFDESGQAWLGDFALGVADRLRTAREDVHDLAMLVRACVPHPSDELSEVVARGASAVDRPTVQEFVPLLLAALAGQGPDRTGALPNPYKGLRAFDEADAVDFFGRAGLVDDLLARLRRHDLAGRLVLVVGGSGTGKSSVVRAGLLPRIRRGDVPGSQDWFVTTMLPGATPFKELAAALRRVAVTDPGAVVDELTRPGGFDAVVRDLLPAGGELLLVVDQFEELFTSAPEADQRRFLDAVMDAVTRPDSRVRVVATLRADFYDRPLAFQPFGGAVNGATVTIPAMSAAELEAAIVEPAERVGRRVDRALVAELVGAAVDEPAGLPSLQFALFELAERSDGDLVLEGYRQLGGLSGAIASRAEALYRSLDDDDRTAVRRLFNQLVVVNADGEPTRRRATRTEVSADDPSLDRLIDRWADARLLSLDRHRQSRLPTVEPAHEALLREWPRLRRWVEEDRGSLLVLGGVREAALSWEELDRDPGSLYRGARLQVVLDTLDPTTLGAREREFLDASRAARDAEEREAVERVERTARDNRRLRRQLVVTGVALVVALVGGAIALDQRQDALRERRVAYVRELAAAADASLEEDPERATLIALEALAASETSDTNARPEALGALHNALSTSRVMLTVPGVGGSLDWSADGSVFITEGPEDSGLVDLRDAETGESVRSWTGHEVDINQVTFSPRGDQLATGGDDGYLRVWDTDTGDLVAEFDRHDGESASAHAFSPDGRLVVGHWADLGETVVFDVRSGEEILVIRLDEVHGVDYSPDGTTLALGTVGEDGVYLHDARTGERIRRLGIGTDHARVAKFSPDGRWLASAHGDGFVRIWDANEFELRFTVTGHTSEVNSVAWSPDSTRLATAGNDGTARVHDLFHGGVEEAVVVSGRDTGGGIAVVAFSPDGQRIMTGDWAVTSVQVWDVREVAGGEWATIRSVPSPPGSGLGSFLPDGSGVLVTNPTGGVGIMHPETGEERSNLDVGATRNHWVRLATSPDGSLLAASEEGSAVIIDLDTGAPVAEVAATKRSFVIDMAWDRDAQHLAIAHFSDVNTVTIVDRNGAEVAEFRDEEESLAFVSAVSFVGDGDLVAMSTFPHRPTPEHRGLRAWDWRAGEFARALPVTTSDLDSDPTGPRVVAAEEFSRAAHIYDMRTGERLHTLQGAGYANAVAYSADGSRVALASGDGSVRVFDADSGRLELILRGHDRAVTTVSFSPDGTKLSSADEGGMVRVWALDTKELVGIARSRVTRALDGDECRQYLRRDRCADD